MTRTLITVTELASAGQWALACHSQYCYWAVNRLWAQPILVSALRASLLRCMHGSRCRTRSTADHVCLRVEIFAFSQPAARRIRVPNGRAAICNVAVIGAREALALCVRSVKGDAVTHVCDSRDEFGLADGMGLFLWVVCCGSVRIAATRISGSPTGIHVALSIFSLHAVLQPCSAARNDMSFSSHHTATYSRSLNSDPRGGRNYAALLRYRCQFHLSLPLVPAPDMPGLAGVLSLPCESVPLASHPWTYATTARILLGKDPGNSV